MYSLFNFVFFFLDKKQIGSPLMCEVVVCLLWDPPEIVLKSPILDVKSFLLLCMCHSYHKFVCRVCCLITNN